LFLAQHFENVARRHAAERVKPVYGKTQSMSLRDHLPGAPVQRHRVGQRAVAIEDDSFRCVDFHQAEEILRVPSLAQRSSPEAACFPLPTLRSLEAGEPAHGSSMVAPLLACPGLAGFPARLQPLRSRTERKAG